MKRKKMKRKCDGFTLLETIMAISVLTVGLLALLALVTNSITTMQFAQEDLIARQKAQETLESLFSARNTQQITFDKIQNVSAGGIFLEGFQPLRIPGADGIVGTQDDGGIENMTLPGPDGLLGTSDDIQQALGTFERQIIIAPVPRADGTANPDLRQVTVTMRYKTLNNQKYRNYQVASYVSRYR
jgi:prepilin-type N-terminal cleavage/methylation domain-containing protein